MSIFAFMAAFAAQPVTMPPPREWPATAGWRIDEFPAGCAASRDEGDTALGLVLLVEGRATVALAHPGLRRGSGAVRLRYRFDAASVEYGLSAPDGGRANGYVTQLRAAEAQDFTRRFAAAATLRVEAPGGAAATFPLRGSAAALRVARRCLARVQADRREGSLRGGVPYSGPYPVAYPGNGPPAPPPPPPPTPPSQLEAGPRPALLRSGTITNDDYPAAALRAREEGSVRVRYTVGIDGRVTDCAVVESSGFATLDATTCILIQRRFRFRPAVDAAGRLIADSQTRRVIWRLPPPPPPPPPPDGGSPAKR
jgi:TonB family protein